MTRVGLGSGAPEPLFALLRFLVGTAVLPPPDQAADLRTAVAALLGSPEWRVLAPLADFRLRGAGDASLLPEEQRATLRRVAAGAVALAMSRRSVLDAICERADRGGVRFMLLKGAALTGWVYPWDAPRLGGDLDLLITPSDAGLVGTVLAGLAGEQDKFPGRPHLRRLAYERSFQVRSPVPVELDVHQGLTYPMLYRIDNEGLWQRALPHPSFGMAALCIPCPEDLLLHLAIHAVHDLKHWSRHDVDAAMLIANEPIDWQRLSERARQWGAGIGLYLLLERLVLGLACPVPEGVLTGLRPGAATLAMTRRILGSAAPEPGGWTPGAARLRQLTAQLWLTRGAWAALRFQLGYAQARVLDRLVGLG